MVSESSYLLKYGIHFLSRSKSLEDSDDNLTFQPNKEDFYIESDIEDDYVNQYLINDEIYFDSTSFFCLLYYLLGLTIINA